MKRLSQKIILLFSLAVIYSCVEKYQDANPPHLMDSPAVYSVDATSDLITDGSSTKITINVVDAPAGIDSVGYAIADENGDPVGSVSIDNLSSVLGQTKGQIEATYTSMENTAAMVTITFTVFDKQFSEGEVVRKSSVPQSVEIEVVCESNLAGTYTSVVSGTSTDPGANVNPVSDLASEVTLKSAGKIGEYVISDASAGIYDAWYLGVYYDSPSTITAILKDACGSISISTFTDGPFGDSDGVDSSSGEVDQNGVISLTVTNVYGDEWTMTLTPK
jgi:hypothetical protein